MWLLDRKIASYWERKARDEQQLRKMQESAKQYSTSFTPINQQYSAVEPDDNSVGSEFLATLQ